MPKKSKLKSRHEGWLAVALSCIFCVQPACTQPDEVSTPLNLVIRMAHAETDAVPHKKHYLYRRRERSSRTKGHQWDELVVEIPAGRIRRLVAVDGHALTQSQKAAEDARIQSLIQHPEDLARDNEGRKEDESKTTELLAMLPKAFLFTSDGMQNECLRVRFQPNPVYQERSYQERVIHASAGTLLIHPGDDRLCSLDTKLQYQVEFGYGLLGKVSQGSGFFMERQQLAPGQWKTSQLRVHVDGNVLMLKSVSRQEDSQHFGFQEVPYEMTVPQAVNLVLSTNY